MSVHRRSLGVYEDVLNQLKAKGIRLTESRKAVIRYLMMSDQHPSADVIYYDICTRMLIRHHQIADVIYYDLLPDNPGMSLATVYNNLKVLVEEGIVSEIKVNNDNTTYYDFMGHDHLNIVCEKCGHITDLDLPIPSFKEEVESQTGFRITREQMILHGICPNCQ